MSSHSSRHESDLRGQLAAFSEARKHVVTIILDDTAQHHAVQHCAWMLLNMLIRFDGFVERVVVCCPEAVTLRSDIIPLAVEEATLARGLVATANSLNLLPTSLSSPSGLPIYIGPGEAVTDGFRAYGDGWTGGISTGTIIHVPESTLPFGPYAAACIAAAEVFKLARMKPDEYQAGDGFFDFWKLQSSPDMLHTGPTSLGSHDLSCILAGIGAVGCAFLHTMAVCPDLQLAATLADNDSKGVELSNLNRYVLFGTASLCKSKPDEAVRILSQGHMKLTPHNGDIGSLEKVEGRVLSAVDKNSAREAIQYRYPARIISASTSDLRSEALRCGPPGRGACLRCYNPREPIPPDDQIVKRLKAADPEEFQRICTSAGVSIEDAASWLKTRSCGSAGSALLKYMRQSDPADDAGVFAVGFTSVFAGVLLAVEFIKDCLGISEGLNDSANRVNFQFFTIATDVNGKGFIDRDPECPCCIPGNPATKIWETRFRSL